MVNVFVNLLACDVKGLLHKENGCDQLEEDLVIKVTVEDVFCNSICVFREAGKEVAQRLPE